MHEVLLRFNVSDPFSFSWQDSVPVVGAAALLIPWTIFAILTLRAAKPSEGSIDPFSLAFWIGVPVVAAIVVQRIPKLMETGIPVFSYGFMLFVGFMAATLSAVRRAKLLDLEKDVLWDLGAWLLIPGIIGARAFYIMQYHERMFALAKNPGDVIKAAINLPDGGLVFYGGLLAGIAGYLTFCYLRRINPMQLADVIAPSIFIGLGFGRIGCFMYGCCYGDRCDLPWSVTFPPGSITFQALVDRGFITESALGTLPLHPSQIYSSMNAFIIAGLLAVYFRHRAFNGAVLGLGWVIYPVTRFVLELLRGDELGQFNTQFTISQYVSLGIFSSGLIFLLVMSRVQPRFSQRGMNVANT